MRKRKDDHQSRLPRNEKDDRTGQGIKIVIKIQKSINMRDFLEIH